MIRFLLVEHSLNLLSGFISHFLFPIVNDSNLSDYTADGQHNSAIISLCKCASCDSVVEMLFFLMYTSKVIVGISSEHVYCRGCV